MGLWDDFKLGVAGVAEVIAEKVTGQPQYYAATVYADQAAEDAEEAGENPQEAKRAANEAVAGAVAADNAGALDKAASRTASRALAFGRENFLRAPSRLVMGLIAVAALVAIAAVAWSLAPVVKAWAMAKK